MRIVPVSPLITSHNKRAVDFTCARSTQPRLTSSIEAAASPFSSNLIAHDLSFAIAPNEIGRFSVLSANRFMRPKLLGRPSGHRSPTLQQVEVEDAAIHFVSHGES